MTLENALDTYLKADTTLNTAVGGRIYWMQALQTATMPYLVYTIIGDTDRQFAFGINDTGSAKVQFDVVGSTKVHKSIMYRVRTLMRGITGTYGGIVIYSSFPSGLFEKYNPDTNRYVFTCTYDIEFNY